MENLLQDGTFWTVAIGILTLLGKQWTADRKMFKMIEHQNHVLDTMDKRQESFQKTVDTIQGFIVENSKEHVKMMEQLGHLDR